MDYAKALLTELLISIRRQAWLRFLGRTVLKLPGVGGVSRRLARHILPEGERVWVQISTGHAKGLWLQVEPYLEEGYINGCPGPGVQEELLEYLGPGDCFYDIGAHIGFYSLVASRLVGEKGCVVAFEPDPHNITLLRENAIRSRASQIIAVQAAVWSCSGVLPFRRSPPERLRTSTRRGHIHSPAQPREGPGVIDVEATTLDAFVHGHIPPTMVKIDVEGGEVDVLKGAQQLLKTNPVLLCEVHHLQAASILEDELPRNGYSLKWLKGSSRFPYPRHLLACPAKVRDKG